MPNQNYLVFNDCTIFGTLYLLFAETTRKRHFMRTKYHGGRRLINEGSNVTKLEKAKTQMISSANKDYFQFYVFLVLAWMDNLSNCYNSKETISFPSLCLIKL
jgi:hypothetical protein